MAFKVDASFEHGVFVPSRRPSLGERDRVRLTIEPVSDAEADSKSLTDGGNLPDLSSRTGLAIALDFHPDGC
jgi:hypothetical protein